MAQKLILQNYFRRNLVRTKIGTRPANIRATAGSAARFHSPAEVISKTRTASVSHPNGLVIKVIGISLITSTNTSAAPVINPARLLIPLLPPLLPLCRWTATWTDMAAACTPTAASFCSTAPANASKNFVRVTFSQTVLSCDAMCS